MRGHKSALLLLMASACSRTAFMRSTSWKRWYAACTALRQHCKRSCMMATVMVRYKLVHSISNSYHKLVLILFAASSDYLMPEDI